MLFVVLKKCLNLQKYLRGSDNFSLENLTEEVSHVLLLTNVIAKEFRLDTKNILEHQMDAVRRMEEEDGNN